MRKLSLLLFVCAIVAINLSSAPSANAQKGDKFRTSAKAVPNRYIVVLSEDVVKVNDILPPALKAELVSRASNDLAASYGGKIDVVYKNTIKGYAAEMSAEAAERLSQDARVKYVEEDFIVYGNETQTNATWGLDRIDQRNRPLDSYYNYTTTGAGVHVYILDSGIRATHGEFSGRLGGGADFVNDGQNGNDCNGHGTHVAGTAGGSNYGVAKQVTLHNVRVLGCDNTGTGSAILAGIDWIASNRGGAPSVVNMSVGMDTVSATVDGALGNSIAQGINYVVAAGNFNSDACNYSPSRISAAITVGATDINDQRASFSNYGACVDLFAPGVAISSAGIGGDSAASLKQGTSMAAPHVTGVVARFLQENPAASPSAVEGFIKNSATPNVITNAGAGSPNLLLFSEAGFSPPPPPAIVINDSGPAAPYPSIYTVSGLTQAIADAPNGVEVKINGYSHNYSANTSLVLEGPTGARLLIQSRAGGNTTAPNVSYTISDSGATQMSNAALVNGAVYKPTALSLANVSYLPSFPPPGPGGAYNNPGPIGSGNATFASTFGGTNPNGAWKLYAVDEFFGASGSIVSWSLNITTGNQLVDTSVNFVGEDRYTQGSWVGRYGAQGASVIGDASNLPSWAQLTVSGQNSHTWAASTADVRALNKLSNSNEKIAATYYSATQINLHFNLTDGQTHRLALYILDWEGNSRSQTFELINPQTGAVLDTRSAGNFNGGRYLVWNVKGRFIVRIKNNSGGQVNAVVNGIFFDQTGTALPGPADASATFAGVDDYTRGDWAGNYGAQGSSIFGDAANLPSWAQLTIKNQTALNWSGSTTDNRALKKLSNSNDRVASSVAPQYAYQTLDLSFNLTDGQAHRLALYVLDWEPLLREQSITIINTDTESELDSRYVSNFTGGKYIVWNVKGKFTVRIKTFREYYNINAVLSGIFLDGAGSPLPNPPPGPAPTPVPTPPPAPTPSMNVKIVGVDEDTKGNWRGKYGSEGALVVGGENNLPGWLQYAVTGNQPVTWQDPSGDERAPFKSNNSNVRVAAANSSVPTDYAPSYFEMSFDFTDGKAHRLALYCVDWDDLNRDIQFDFYDQGVGGHANFGTMQHFGGGKYIVWEVRGKFKLRVLTFKQSSTSVVSGIFIDPSQISPPPPPPYPTTASFVGFDSSSKGDWVGNYGSQGHSIANGTTNLPGWAQLSLTGQNVHTWNPSTGDVRALKKAADNNDRIASAFYTAPAHQTNAQFEMNFDFTDGKMHRLALYSLDWEGTTRSQTYELSNANTGQVLDTRTTSYFNGGVYTVWQVQGKFKIRVINNGRTSANAVVSGVFLDPPGISLPTPSPTPVLTPPPLPPVETAASFVGFESDTKGNWVGNYGTEGHLIVNETTNLPAWAQLSMTGQNAHTWTNSTTDVRALRKAGNHNERIASTFHAPSQFEMNFYLTDGQTHRLALYSLDWEGNTRRQTFELVDTATGAVLDARTISNFNGGVYVVWQVKGKFAVRIKNDGGSSANSVLGGVFLDPAGTSLPTPTPGNMTVNFVRFDANSKGDWLSNYGGQGYSIVNETSNLPPWAELSITGQNAHTWASSTADARALIKTGSSDRIASTFYTPSQIEMAFNLTDGQMHRLAVYSLDWEGNTRNQTFEIIDPTTGAVLDTRAISSFNGGVYAVWQVKGKFTVRVKNNGGTSANAVVSGIFLDSPTAEETAVSFTGFDTNTKGNWVGSFGGQGYSIVNEATNLPSWARFSVTGQNAHTWGNPASDIRALVKASNNNERIASTFHAPSQFEMNFYLTDGQTHRLALYSLDWEGNTRRQTFELVDTATGAVLDARTISNFNGGVYVVWQVKGKFAVRVKNDGGANAVVSGIFLDNQ